MKIGIDIDGVVLDYEKGMLANAEIFDIEKCSGKGKIFSEKYGIQYKYDWTEEQRKQFIFENLGNISRESSIMAGAKYVLSKLKQMGHELIIIEKENINFDKYYWKQTDKLEICKAENIDIMIDDNTTTCKNLSDNKIETIYFRGIRGTNLEEGKYLKEVSNWGEIYRYIKEL